MSKTLYVVAVVCYFLGACSDAIDSSVIVFGTTVTVIFCTALYLLSEEE